MGGSILEAIGRSGFCFEQVAREYPELQKLKNVLQNPEYHGEGDVYVHTGMVCGCLARLPEWSRLSLQEQRLLFLAAAFHDIGKPVCTRLEAGAWASPKHTIIGEKEFRRMAYRGQERFGLTFEERELTARLIRYHGLPVWFWKKRRPEFDLMKAAESIPLRLLYLLAKADAAGRIGKSRDQLFEQVELFADSARKQGIWEKPYPFANAYTRYQYFHKDQVWPGVELYDPTEFDVILLSGLPLAGKDTWIGLHGQGRKVVSLDDIREEFGLSPAKGSARAADIATKRAKGLLRQKEPFIWNGTNLIRETREKLIRLFSGYGARVRIVYLEVPYQEMLKRNRTRERQLPEDVLEEMIRKLEIPAPWEAYALDDSGAIPHAGKRAF